MYPDIKMNNGIAQAQMLMSNERVDEIRRKKSRLEQVERELAQFKALYGELNNPRQNMDVDN